MPPAWCCVGTPRNEDSHLPTEFRRGDAPDGYGDAFGAPRVYFEQGIDGFFADQPDSAPRAAVDSSGGSDAL
jgi:glycerophosphoryl diester phosphodiesterase